MAPPPVLLLSPSQLSQLIPLVPSMLLWLRHCEPKSAGELFLKAQTNMDEIQGTLRELLNANNFNEGDLTNVQLKYIFSCHEVDTWAGAVRVVLGESDPRLVPNEVAGALTASLSLVHDAADGDEVARILGTHLDQLPRSSFVALAEFCAVIRDTVSDSSQLACLVGPMLLAPRVGFVSTSAASSSAALMDVLIEEAESIFGRVAGFNRKDAMGIRKVLPPPLPRRASRHNMAGAPGSSVTGSLVGGGGGAPLAPPPGLGGPSNSATSFSDGSTGAPGKSAEVDMKLAKENKRRDQLRAFFQFKANGNGVKDMSDVVDELFGNHDFEDIAKGIYDRYNLLPPGWSHDLTDLQNNQGSTKLEWFKDAKINMQKAANSKGRPISFVAAPPPRSPAPQNLPKMDMIVNEIIDTEETYRDNLEELLQNYIVPVREIALGRRGKEAAEELGLTSTEIERIFGWRIGEITKVSAALQKKLEVVNLCRGKVRSELGRQGLVAQAFLSVAGDLHVYAPYVSAHKTSLQTLEKALALINSKDSKKGMLGSGLLRGKEKEVITFVKMWEVVSTASARLKGQTISSLLILPIQRVPRYKLLLSELQKGTPADHPAQPFLTDALSQINDSAKQINEALRQHEKLEKFFGQEDMLSPSISEGGKGGKIKQGYVDA